MGKCRGLCMHNWRILRACICSSLVAALFGKLAARCHCIGLDSKHRSNIAQRHRSEHRLADP